MNAIKKLFKPTLLLGEVLCVLDGRDHPLDGEEGSQVGRVRGDDDEGEEPPDPAHDPSRGGLRVQPGTLRKERLRG